MAELLHRPETLHIHMPVYNGEDFVGPAIDSVLADMDVSEISEDDFRLMIADDASTDGTPTILQRYANHPSIEIFRYHQNLGVGGNRARLLEETLGQDALPYAISVREQDDLSIPGSSKALLGAMEKQEAQLVGGAMLEFIGDDMSHTTLLGRANGKEQIEQGLLRGHVPVWNASMMFDPQTVSRLGISHPTARYCDDLLFMAQLINGGATAHNIEDPVVMYRKHPESITTGWKPANAYWYLKAMRQVWRESPLNPSPSDRAYVAAQAALYLTSSKSGAPFQMARHAYRAVSRASTCDT